MTKENTNELVLAKHQFSKNQDSKISRESYKIKS